MSSLAFVYSKETRIHTIQKLLDRKIILKMGVEVEITTNDINSILNNVKDVDLVYCSHKLDTNDKIGGFLAQHYYLTVNVRNSQNIQRSLNFFIKYDSKTINYLNDYGVFQKETGLYKELLPQLMEFSKETPREWGVKCFLVKSDQLIVLENVSLQGYRMAKKSGLTLDVEHILVALKTMGYFHASSFIYEKKVNAKLIDLFPKLLEENAYPKHLPNSMRHRGVHNAIKTGILPLIKEIPKYKNSPDLNQIVQKFEEVTLTIFDLIQPSNEYPNCFNHADIWSNNILFKYDENNRPTSSKFVDFQMSRYSPQSLDVMSLIILNCCKRIYDPNMKLFMETYYEAFDKELKSHSMSAEKIISFARFEESCKKFRLMGHIETVLFCHLNMMPKQYTKSLTSNNKNYDNLILNDRSVCLEAFRNEESYRSRMIDVLEAMIEEFVLGEFN